MRTQLSSLLALAFLTPAPALAQPAATEPAAVVVAEPERRWGIGVHLGGMGLEPTTEDGEEVVEGDADRTDLGAAGLQVRFRLHRRWELELSATHFAGELGDTGQLRSSGSLTLGGMFHFNPGSRWLWSGLLGVGGTHDTISVEKGDERVTTAEFSEGHVRLGVGLERRFDRIGIAAQLYGIAFERNDDELDGPAYEGRDGPVPARSSGGLFLLVGNWYF